MVDLANPLGNIATGARGSLLRELARLEKPVTRRQLAAVANLSPGHANGVIEALVRAGLVSETRAGGALMVQLNADHLATASIVALAGLRGELIRRLRERISAWPDVVGAWIFGSVARGDAGEYSDIDVLLVADDLESEDLHLRIAALRVDTRAWTGNDLQLVEHSPASWHRLRSENNELVEQVRLDGIALGENDPSLLRRQR